MGFFDNIKDAAKNVGVTYDDARRSFNEGNVAGGIYTGALGTLAAIGNIVTLGGANALGNMVKEHSKSSGGIFDSTPKEVFEDASENPAGFVSNMASNVGNMLLEGTSMISKSMSDNCVNQHNLARSGQVEWANALGAVDCGLLALNIATCSGATSGIASAAKGAVSKASSSIVSAVNTGTSASSKAVGTAVANAVTKASGAVTSAIDAVGSSSSSRVANAAARFFAKSYTNEMLEASQKSDDDGREL